MPSVHWFGHVLCFYLWARLKLVYSNLCCFFVVKSCQTFATAWTVAHQAPWSMGFPRQGYWNELLFPPPGDLPKGIKPTSPALQADSLSPSPLGSDSNLSSLLKTLLVGVWASCAQLRGYS